jgi:hypothetical protein
MFYIYSLFGFFVSGVIWGRQEGSRMLVPTIEKLFLTVQAFFFPGILFILFFPLTVIVWLIELTGELMGVEELARTVLAVPAVLQSSQGSGNLWVGIILYLLATYLGINFGATLTLKERDNIKQNPPEEKKPRKKRTVHVILYIAVGMLIGILILKYAHLIREYPISLSIMATALGIGGGIMGYLEAKKAYNSSRVALLWAIVFFLVLLPSFLLYEEINPLRKNDS